MRICSLKWGSVPTTDLITLIILINASSFMFPCSWHQMYFVIWPWLVKLNLDEHGIEFCFITIVDEEFDIKFCIFTLLSLLRGKKTKLHCVISRLGPKSYPEDKYRVPRGTLHCLGSLPDLENECSNVFNTNICTEFEKYNSKSFIPKNKPCNPKILTRWIVPSQCELHSSSWRTVMNTNWEKMTNSHYHHHLHHCHHHHHHDQYVL